MFKRILFLLLFLLVAPALSVLAQSTAPERRDYKVMRENAGASVPTPTTGYVNLWYDVAADMWEYKKSDATTGMLGGGGGMGAASWSGLTNPSANLALTMAGYTSTFTFNGTTGAGVNLFNLTDTGGNTGTGALLRSFTAATSNAKPFSFTARGTSNGVEMNTSGIMVPLGSGGFSATGLVTGTVPNARVAEVLAVTDLSTYATVSGTGTAAVAGTFTGLTANDVLTWNGTNWINQAGGGAAAGSNTQVIFNDSGVYSGDAGLTYVKATDALTVIGPLAVGTSNIAAKAQIVTLDDTTPDTIVTWDDRHFVVGDQGDNGGVGISYTRNTGGGYGVIGVVKPGVAWQPLLINAGGGNVGIGLGTALPTTHFDVRQNADSTNTATAVAFTFDSVGAAGELTAASGTQTFGQVAPIINQSGTAGYDALAVAVTETATGSGTRNLLNLLAGGVSKASISSAGTATFGGVILPADGSAGAPSIARTGQTSVGVWFTNGRTHLSGTSGEALYVSRDDAGTNVVNVGSTMQFTWSPTTTPQTGGFDTGLARSGAGIVKVTNGSTGYGILYTALGAVGAPAYSFGTDTNTGIYSSAADNFDVTTGGVNRLNIGSGGIATFSNNAAIGTAGAVRFSSASTEVGLTVSANGFPFVKYSLEQTPDALMLGTGSISRGLVVCDYASVLFDFAHPLQTNPTIFVHSAAQNTSQWLGLTHDGTNGVISTGTGSVSVSSVLAAKAGASTSYAKVGGSLFDHYADASSTSTDGTEDDLYSDTTPASVLGADGDKLVADYGGSFVSSATATRKVKVYFAGTAIFDSTALILSSGNSWTCRATIVRNAGGAGTGKVRYAVTFTTEGASTASYTKTGELTGLTLSGTNILKVTGAAASTGAASGDIKATVGTVYWKPAA